MYKRKLPDGFQTPRLYLIATKRFDYYLFPYITKCTISFSSTNLLTTTKIVMFTIMLSCTKNSFEALQVSRNAFHIPKLKQQKSKKNFWYRVHFLVNKLSACLGFDLITMDYNILKEKLTEKYLIFLK